MKHKKLLIVLIVVIAVLILAAGGFAFAYMTTDIFKTDQQLFYKYIYEVGKDISALNSEALGNYLERTQSTPNSKYYGTRRNLTKHEFRCSKQYEHRIQWKD